MPRLIGGPYNGRHIKTTKPIISLENPQGGRPCWYRQLADRPGDYLYAGNHKEQPKDSR